MKSAFGPDRETLKADDDDENKASRGVSRDFKLDLPCRPRHLISSLAAIIYCVLESSLSAHIIVKFLTLACIKRISIISFFCSPYCRRRDWKSAARIPQSTSQLQIRSNSAESVFSAANNGRVNVPRTTAAVSATSMASTRRTGAQTTNQLNLAGKDGR